MEAAKEKISNISASAKAGTDKTKATAEEKAEKIMTKDPLQKETAEERKEEKIRQAELEKQQAHEQNAIRKGEAHHTGVGHQTGLGGHNTGVGPQTGLGEPTSGHQTGLGGHHTAVGHQTGLGEPTSGVPGLHRTDAPVAGTKTNLSEH